MANQSQERENIDSSMKKNEFFLYFFIYKCQTYRRNSFLEEAGEKYIYDFQNEQTKQLVYCKQKLHEPIYNKRRESSKLNLKREKKKEADAQFARQVCGGLFGDFHLFALRRAGGGENKGIIKKKEAKGDVLLFSSSRERVLHEPS